MSTCVLDYKINVCFLKINTGSLRNHDSNTEDNIDWKMNL